jgi:ribonucleoside-diphosphate reductase alpha chain
MKDNLKYEIKTDLTRDSLFDELGITRLKESYMKEGETSPQERFAFVSSSFASNQEHAQRLYEYSSKHWLSYSTPILSFGRNKKGQPISCFLNHLEDTAEGLVDNLSETNWLSMMGGGVGVHVRIRGTDEKSVGVMPHLKVYDVSSLAYKQGSTRRGSYAAYLDIDHPDIIQFIEMRKATGDQNMKALNLNHGVNISDKFMQLIEDCIKDPTKDDSWDLIQPHSKKVVDTVSAKYIWMKLLELRMQTGEPYFWFIDAANRALPEFQKKLGLKNYGSNLCVAPETLILTDEGYQQISELQDEEVNVWNGNEFSKVTVRKTGENQKLLKVVTNSGFELECTPYHKFYVAMRNPNSGSRWTVEKRAHELEAGDKLIKCDFPIISGDKVLDFAYENGLFSAEGCYSDQGKRIYLYGEKRKIKEHLSDIFGKWTVQEKFDREYAHSLHLKDKFFVPLDDYCVTSKVKWFAGLCDGDATVARTGATQSIQLCSINKNFLLETQLMLQTIGISSKVTVMHEAGVRKLPLNDGSGELGDFQCQTSYRLLIGQSGIVTLQGLGFKPIRLYLTRHQPNREATHFVKVVEVIDEGRFDDTYCFTEPKKGMGVFNGILTGQCSEISLATSAERTAVCCLSSVNLEYYDEWKNDKQFLYDVLEMLDNVIQYFIENAPDTISRARYSAMRERSVGVGALGYHAYLQKHNIAFESDEARELNKEIFQFIRSELDSANEQLAVLRGACPDAEESGVMKRCTHVMAVAPNASSSIIMGNTSPSIEPYAANAYRQDTSSGAFLNKNKYLDKIIKEESEKHEPSWYDDTWASIIANDGSVQHLECLTDHQKAVFKTAPEINQMVIVQQSADRQQYVDQAISTNLFFRPDTNIKYLHDVHFAAWKLGMKSLYYLRSSKLRKADKVGQKIKRERIEDEQVEVSQETCLACEG